MAQAAAAQLQRILPVAELLPEDFFPAFLAELLAHSTVPMALNQKFPWHSVGALVAAHQIWRPAVTAAKVRLDLAVAAEVRV